MSLRWVQVLAPTKSARIRLRRSSREVPAKRPALVAASGHWPNGKRAGDGLGRACHVGPGVDVGAERVLVDDGLDARFGRVAVAEHRVDGQRRLRGVSGDHVDAAAPAHPVGWDRVRELVPRQRIVRPGQRRRLGSERDRDVTQGDDVGDDRAAGLPARAHVGEREEVSGCAVVADRDVQPDGVAGVAALELR